MYAFRPGHGEPINLIMNRAGLSLRIPSLLETYDWNLKAYTFARMGLFTDSRNLPGEPRISLDLLRYI
jgi:hypothetical protein